MTAAKLAVPGYRAVVALAFPPHRDMRPHMEHTLRALKADLEPARSAALEDGDDLLGH